MTIPNPALDMPDDYDWLSGSTHSPLGDLGELAVRLDSPVGFDRRGDVVWFDTFGYGLSGYATAASGLGSDVITTDAERFRWPYVCELLAGTTLGMQAGIEKISGAYGGSRYGVEAGIAVKTAFTYFYFSLEQPTALTAYKAEVRFKDATSTLEIRIDTGAWVTVYGVALPVSDPATFNHFKLVADFDTGRYIRIMLNQEEIDLSGYSMYDDAAIGAGLVGFQMILYGGALVNAESYISHVIITASEP